MKFNSPAPTLPASWMPQVAAPPAAVPMQPLIVGIAPVIRHPRETQILPAISYHLPESLDDLLAHAHGSAAGFHAVSSFLGCPTKSQLERQGVTKKGDDSLLDRTGKMEKRSFGTLIHALLAVRTVYGQSVAERLLIRPNGTPTPDFGPVGAQLGIEDIGRSLTIVKMYDLEFPMPMEPWTYLGIEVEVCTDIGDGLGGSCVRSAIYDGVVKRHDQPDVVWSLEKKTSSRSGTGAMDVYTPQFATQCVVWNANPSLVQRYGPMAGVIPDVIVKSAVPKCERHLPRYISRFMQHLQVRYLRLPDQIRYPVDDSGEWPKMLHHCWGKFDPCQFVDLCWEGAHGSYNWPETAQAQH